MRASPLIIKEYFLSDLHFTIQTNFKNVNLFTGIILPDDLQVEVAEGKNEENPLLRNCKLSVALEDLTGSKYPYNFSITLVGFFEVSEDWASEQVDKLVSANAPALLYSAAREAISTLTGRSPYLKALLPSITFVNLPLPSTKTQSPEEPKKQRKKVRSKKNGNES